MSLTLIQQHLTEMDFAFQNVVNSFHVSIEARTTNTGPASATLSAFTIDLCGPAGRFGQVHLPAITTHSDGAPIIVTEQLVKILDKAALQAFIQPVIVADRATLVLRNGHTAVKALGVGPKPICYEKDIPMSGMLGPRVSVHDATYSSTPAATDAKASEGEAAEAAAAAPLTVTIHVANPSPMEISFGLCALEIQNETGETFATLQGDLDIRCNRFEATFRGTVNRDVKVGRGGARLVGKRCMGAGWCDETVRQINTPLIGMGKVFEALGIAHEEEEDTIQGKEGGLTTTTEKSAPAANVLEEPLKAASKLWQGRFWRTQVSS
ncbi:hypothetical protein SLS62_002285 [Diatrype stigma]|uniref:Uncharacterized protein n=1 Tax=Diatrype stigma TaxID=117547 RepID=A0AAN9YVA8_9PEZI